MPEVLNVSCTPGMKSAIYDCLDYGCFLRLDSIFFVISGYVLYFLISRHILNINYNM